MKHEIFISFFTLMAAIGVVLIYQLMSIEPRLGVGILVGLGCGLAIGAALFFWLLRRTERLFLRMEKVIDRACHVAEQSQAITERALRRS